MERDGRYPAGAEIGTGGELIPNEPELPKLRDTVTNPDYVAVDASRDRLALANLAGVLELALDASDTVVPKNSLEKMLVHQMAAASSPDYETVRPDGRPVIASAARGAPAKIDELCRLGASIPRLAAAYESGLLALQRVRSGGKQFVTVQHVHVADGGQAVVAAKLGGKGTGGYPKVPGGERENDE